MIDERLITALHVQAMRRRDLAAGADRHALFQTSTIGALLDGAYEGDVSVGELARHGDLGLGTLNGLDGEMIVLDGRFYRADVDGAIDEIDPRERTPFAVVVPFEAALELELGGPLGHAELLEQLDAAIPDHVNEACAVRIDGRFSLVRARSVPRQQRPYRPLAAVLADQRVFEIRDVGATLVGFRFPEQVEGLEVSGYHLHFIDADRRVGGHVLDSRTEVGRAAIDHSSELRVELPPGVELGSSAGLDPAAWAALRRAETEG